VSETMNWPERFPDLETARLVMRPTGDADVDVEYAMRTDPVVMRYWSSPPIREIAEARAAVERAKGYFGSREGIRWILTRKGDDRMIGSVGVFAFHEQNRLAEIGYALAREHWGHGYMNEALVAAIDYAFGPFGLRRLEADTDPRNTASVRTLERLGFAREGLLRERWQVGDEISDSLVWGLLARDWPAHRAAAVRTAAKP
jgi:[ribosomal protein S5]-alanine N-acetyltransferase